MIQKDISFKMSNGINIHLTSELIIDMKELYGLDAVKEIAQLVCPENEEMRIELIEGLRNELSN